MTRKTGQELIIRCREVADFTEQASKDGDLINLLAVVSSRVRIYAFKSRFKGANNILKKVVQKRREGRRLLLRFKAEQEELKSRTTPTSAETARLDELAREIRSAGKLRDYNPDHITDAWGCRFVTLYQSEIPVTISALLAELHAFNEGGHGAPVRLKEFVIYTNRPAQDPLSIVAPTLEALERSNFPDSISSIREPENRKSAYSSVHLVFDRDVEIEHAGKPRTTELAAFEIQVRDIFEEGWGEVQHHLLYSEKEDGTDPQLDDDEDGGPTWRLHLNALKTFVDGCSQHASIIRMQFDASKRAPISTEVIQSVTDRTDDRTTVIQTLKRLEAPEQAIEAISNAYALLESGEQALSLERKIARFMEAGKAFEDGLGLLNKRCADAQVKERTVRYYLAMEFANSRMATADANLRMTNPDDSLEKVSFADARRVFSEMALLFPADPVAHLRLGKVSERLATTDPELRNAQAITEKGIDLIASDSLTGTDHWIAITSRIENGFILWRLAQNQETELVPDALDLISEAAEANLGALDIWQSQSEIARLSVANRMSAHKAASNMLFFAGKLIESERISKRINEAALRGHIQMIEDLAVEVYSDFYKTRDNFLHAYRALKEDEKARELADENFRELRRLAESRYGRPLDTSVVPRYLRGSEARCFNTARRFLFPET